MDQLSYASGTLQNLTRTQSFWRKIVVQEQIGGWAAFLGVLAWGYHVWSSHVEGLKTPEIAHRCIEIAAAGTVLWVIAKWRRSVRAD